MRVTGRCKLSTKPHGLLQVSSALIALTFEFERPGLLTAFDTALAPLWTTEIRTDAIDGLVHDGRCWVLDRTGLSGYRPADGACVARIDLPIPPTMQAGGATTVSDGFVVAIEHDGDFPPAPPRLLRVDIDGSMRWTTELSMEGVFLEGRVIDLKDGSLTDRVHRNDVTSWRCSYFTGGLVVASATAVLGHFYDMPPSGIGMAYIVALDDGSLRYRSPMVPIDHVTATASGDFLIGIHGYGAFATWRCWPDIGVVDTWKSSGPCIEHGDDIRVLEVRSDGRQHVARLHPGGKVTRGSRLAGFDTQSVPHLIGDGSLLYYRHGGLYTVRDLTVTDHVSLVDGKPPDSATRIQVCDGCAFIGVSQRGKDDARSTGSLIRVAL